MEKDNKTPKQKEPGQYIGSGIAIGTGIGAALGVALGNVALGFGLGISIGVAIGASLEEAAKKRGEIRTLTKEEIQKKNKMSTIAFIVGLIVAVALVVLYLSLK